MASSKHDDVERRAYAEADKDPRMAAILDVLAPRAGYARGDRSPEFDFGEETKPTAAQVIGMAREILARIDGPGYCKRCGEYVEFDDKRGVLVHRYSTTEVWDVCPGTTERHILHEKG